MVEEDVSGNSAYQTLKQGEAFWTFEMGYRNAVAIVTWICAQIFETSCKKIEQAQTQMSVCLHMPD
jgi:hypothetical protein